MKLLWCVVCLSLPCAVLAKGGKSKEVVPSGTAATMGQTPRVGAAVPRFKLLELGGEGRELALYEIDRPVLLQFWNTTCAVCLREFPEVQAWAKRHPEIRYVPVLSDADGDKGMQQLERLKISTKGVHDLYTIAGTNYGVCKEAECSVPAFFAVGKDHRLRALRTGPEASQPLEQFLESAFR